MVEDVESTVEWYERVFNAERVATLPPEESEGYWWAQVLVDGNALMFQQRGNLEEKLPELEGASLGGSVAFYIDIDDTHSMHDNLESAEPWRPIPEDSSASCRGGSRTACRSASSRR